METACSSEMLISIYKLHSVITHKIRIRTNITLKIKKLITSQEYRQDKKNLKY
jgi:hypothetical protein